MPSLKENSAHTSVERLVLVAHQDFWRSTIGALVTIAGAGDIIVMT